MTAEERDAHDAMAKRASAILRNMQQVAARRASARAIDLRQIGPAQRGVVSYMDAPRAAQDWFLSARAALRRGAGDVGGTILTKVLTRQSKSQASSFKTVGPECGVSAGECRIMFYLGLTGFLQWMDSHRIPDHWNEEYVDHVPRCAAGEVGDACAIAC